MKEPTVQVTPSELAEWLVDLQMAYPGKVVMEFEAHTGRGGQRGLLVSISHTAAAQADAAGARTDACMAWPCSTHKSVLAVAVALCKQVELRLQAQEALAKASA